MWGVEGNLLEDLWSKFAFGSLPEKGWTFPSENDGFINSDLFLPSAKPIPED